jgi:hypothetical protein
MWLPIADATKTPLWLTIVLTVLAGAVAVVSAAISARASRKAARTAQVTANMERFAAWQLHKREVYSTFLSAGIAADGPGDRVFEAARSAVMLTADVETRKYLRDYELPGALADPKTRAAIEERLVADVRIQGPAK